jgi:hypothetical protein
MHRIESNVPTPADLKLLVTEFNGKVLTYPEYILFSFSGIQAMLKQQKFPNGLLPQTQYLCCETNRVFLY